MQYIGQAVGDYVEMVSALALSPDDLKLAVYAYRFDRANPWKGTSQHSYFWIVSTSSGLLISQVIRVDHGKH